MYPNTVAGGLTELPQNLLDTVFEFLAVDGAKALDATCRSTRIPERIWEVFLSERLLLGYNTLTNRADIAMKVTGLGAKQLLARMYLPLTTQQRADAHRCVLFDEVEEFLGLAKKRPRLLLLNVDTDGGLPMDFESPLGEKVTLSPKAVHHAKKKKSRYMYITQHSLYDTMYWVRPPLILQHLQIDFIDIIPLPEEAEYFQRQRLKYVSRMGDCTCVLCNRVRNGAWLPNLHEEFD